MMAVRLTLRHAPTFRASRRYYSFYIHGSSSPPQSFDFSEVRESMLKRRLPFETDYITPTRNRSLRLTLAGYLPFSCEVPRELAYQLDSSLDPTHHLVYFLNVPKGTHLLPDGTDSLHSPGYPFTRRMWAGGTMVFRRRIQADGVPYHCKEWIRDVKMKGDEGEEKIFVDIERAIFPGRYPGEVKEAPRVVEHRTLVFMRENRQEGSPGLVESSSKVLKVFKTTKTPNFFHKMVPTRELLFRFSALTLNAHAIHLDEQFCRAEGHRTLLVQGPLTVVLMIEVLQIHLLTLADYRSSPEDRPETIVQVDYRNLAPLYVDEEMKICVQRREKEIDEGRAAIWDVWIEGPDGRYAVKGTAKAMKKGQVRIHKESRESGEDAMKGHRSYRELGIKSVPEGETIPAEQVALQNSVNARHETVSSEKSSPKEDLSPEEETEKEAEGEAEEERR